MITRKQQSEQRIEIGLKRKGNRLYRFLTNTNKFKKSRIKLLNKTSTTVKPLPECILIKKYKGFTIYRTKKHSSIYALLRNTNNEHK